jgi:cytochrome c556
LVTAVLVWSGLMVAAQQKVTTPEELDKAMKRVNPAMQAVNKAVKSAAYPDARKELGVARQALVDSSAFWALHKKEDAQKFAADALAKLDAFDKVLAAPTVDAEAAMTAARELSASCRSCHQVYRVPLEGGGYQLKPGSIGGYSDAGRFEAELR